MSRPHTALPDQLREKFSRKRGRPRSRSADLFAELFSDYRSRRSIWNVMRWARALDVLRKSAPPDVFAYFDRDGHPRKGVLTALAWFDSEGIVTVAKEIAADRMASREAVEFCKLIRGVAKAEAKR